MSRAESAAVHGVDGARSRFLKSRNVPGPFSAADRAAPRIGGGRGGAVPAETV